MPEAPEVQALCNSLSQILKGRRVIKAWMDHPKLAGKPGIDAFCKALEGQSFQNFDRIGKYLIFELDDRYWICHLKMEGKFLYIDPKQIQKTNFSGLPIKLEELEELQGDLFSHPFLKKHCHARFHLDNGKILAYVDTRKFGRMYLKEKQAEDQNETDNTADNNIVKSQDLKTEEKSKSRSKASKPEPFILDKLGKDVMDETLTGDYLYTKLHKRKIPIKTALLDQGVIAGVGNIYANEILFQAGIHPLQKCADLTLEQFERIAAILHGLMRAAMEEGGTTIKSFSHPGGEGHFQSHLLIYQKELCPKCQSPIEKIQIGQRSAYLCPNCQKLLP